MPYANGEMEACLEPGLRLRRPHHLRIRRAGKLLNPALRLVAGCTHGFVKHPEISKHLISKRNTVYLRSFPCGSFRVFLIVSGTKRGQF
jgi:hypothetical protein